MVKSQVSFVGEVEVLKFPLMARNLNSGIVVFFTNKHEGTVIHTENDEHMFGVHSFEWLDVLDHTVWRVLPKGTKLTLTQE